MILRRRFIAVLASALIVIGASNVRCSSSTESFGEHYPHTRWIDIQTHSIVVDAYSDRLVISQKGKAITIEGIWKGRSFLKQRDLGAVLGYFSVAHEGTRAAFFGDTRFENFTFIRLRPDPN